MPIKFPKFSRRKSAGNSLEAGYEPANPSQQFNTLDQEDHEPGRTSASPVYGGGGLRGQQFQNRGSGTTTGSGSDYYASSSNRLSSTSTANSADAPRTPASTDHYPSHLPEIGQQTPGYHSNKSFGSTSTSGTPNSPGKRSFGGNYGGSTSPQGVVKTLTPLPKLETSLDTSSIFGDDMFSFNTSKNNSTIALVGGSGGSITPTAPKIASNTVMNSYDNHIDIPPVPPPRSYDPGTSSTATATRFTGSSYTAYSNVYSSPTHMDSDRPATSESSPYWDSREPSDLMGGTVPPRNNNNLPRNSRNLTGGQSAPTPPAHSHPESLMAGGGRGNHRTRGSSDSSALKRPSGLGRRSFPTDDEDAAIVASAAVPSHKRPQPQASTSSPIVVGSAKGLKDKVKDRDSGWEEALGSGSSSVNSIGATGSSTSSRETRGHNPMLSRGNLDSDSNNLMESNDATPKAKKTGLVGVQLRDDGDTEYDQSISVAAALAARYEASESPPPLKPQPNKVMTPAQFERYRQQQEDERRTSGNPVDEDDDRSDSSETEEESETERNRIALKQRQKQEAHLSVYRQQMMKITGSGPTEMPLGMHSKTASLSTSMLPLNNSMPHLSLSGPGSSGRNSEEDEDEEIPLGILMAHGFPAKNRAPARLSNSSSQPNLRAAAQNQLGPLPAFARNLPADPYNIGASIVNPSNRMSLAFGGGYGGGSDTRSQSGGSMYGGMPPSQMPGHGGQGGLIGEIMRAEDMKAARKGSNLTMAMNMGMGTLQQQQRHSFPHEFGRSHSPGNGGGLLGMGGGQQGNHGGMAPGIMRQGAGPGMMSGGMGGMQPGMPMGGGGGGSFPGDPMQMQMNAQMHQMHQMMQMNAQMQQMMQMQMLQPPMIGQRPSSMMSMQPPQGNGGFPGMLPPHQRTMSLVEPQFLPFQQGANYASSIAPSQRGGSGGGAMGGGMLGGGLLPPGYTPSIAPSERSTVGLPSRYRPVSVQPGSAASTGARTSTMTSNSGQQWNKATPGPSHLKNSGGPAAGDSDDDEESGWEQLEKKRREQKDGWRKKKESTLGN